MSYEPSSYFIAEQVAEFIIKDPRSENNPKAYDISSEIEENYEHDIDEKEVKKYFKKLYGSDYEIMHNKLEDTYPKYFYGVPEEFQDDDDSWRDYELQDDTDLLDYEDEDY